MTETSRYEHTDQEALQAGEAAMAYIHDGSVEGLPLEFRGVNVFGVIAALRQNDDVLHGETSDLTEDQQNRRDEIEADIDNSVDKNLQYYPFGHNRNVSYEGSSKEDAQRKGKQTSHGMQSRKTAGHRSSRGGEFSRIKDWAAP